MSFPPGQITNTQPIIVGYDPNSLRYHNDVVFNRSTDVFLGSAPILGRFTCYNERTFDFALGYFPEKLVFRHFSRRCPILKPYYAALMVDPPAIPDLPMGEDLILAVKPILEEDSYFMISELAKLASGPYTPYGVTSALLIASNLEAKDVIEWADYLPYDFLYPFVIERGDQIRNGMITKEEDGAGTVVLHGDPLYRLRGEVDGNTVIRGPLVEVPQDDRLRLAPLDPTNPDPNDPNHPDQPPQYPPTSPALSEITIPTYSGRCVDAVFKLDVYADTMSTYIFGGDTREEVLASTETLWQNSQAWERIYLTFDLSFHRAEDDNPDGVLAYSRQMLEYLAANRQSYTLGKPLDEFTLPNNDDISAKIYARIQTELTMSEIALIDLALTEKQDMSALDIGSIESARHRLAYRTIHAITIYGERAVPTQLPGGGVSDNPRNPWANGLTLADFRSVDFELEFIARQEFRDSPDFTLLESYRVDQLLLLFPADLGPNNWNRVIIENIAWQHILYARVGQEPSPNASVSDQDAPEYVIPPFDTTDDPSMRLNVADGVMVRNLEFFALPLYTYWNDDPEGPRNERYRAAWEQLLPTERAEMNIDLIANREYTQSVINGLTGAAQQEAIDRSAVGEWEYTIDFMEYLIEKRRGQNYSTSIDIDLNTYILSVDRSYDIYRLARIWSQLTSGEKTLIDNTVSSRRQDPSPFTQDNTLAYRIILSLSVYRNRPEHLITDPMYWTFAGDVPLHRRWYYDEADRLADYEPQGNANNRYNNVFVPQLTLAEVELLNYNQQYQRDRDINELPGNRWNRHNVSTLKINAAYQIIVMRSGNTIPGVAPFTPRSPIA